MRPLLPTINQWIFISWLLYFTFHVFIQQFGAPLSDCVSRVREWLSTECNCYVFFLLLFFLGNSNKLYFGMALKYRVEAKEKNCFDGFFFLSFLFVFLSWFEGIACTVIFHMFLCVALKNMRNWTGISLCYGDMYHVVHYVGPLEIEMIISVYLDYLVSWAHGKHLHRIFFAFEWRTLFSLCGISMRVEFDAYLVRRILVAHLRKFMVFRFEMRNCCYLRCSLLQNE